MASTESKDIEKQEKQEEQQEPSPQVQKDQQSFGTNNFLPQFLFVPALHPQQPPPAYIPVESNLSSSTKTRDDGNNRMRCRRGILIFGTLFVLFFFMTTSFEHTVIEYVWTGGDNCTDNWNNSGYPLVNLDFAKANIQTYHSSGQYDSDLWSLVNKWNDVLASNHNETNKTVVFDIDDTVLANYPEMLATDFGYIPKIFDAWVQSANASSIEQTKWLYEHVLQNGYKVVFITGRKDTQEDATIKNLNNVGFTGYDRLITRNSTEYDLTAEAYKSERRRSLESEGYSIIGCVGDQYSDCAGGYTVYSMKVPNYCYYIA